MSFAYIAFLPYNVLLEKLAPFLKNNEAPSPQNIMEFFMTARKDVSNAPPRTFKLKRLQNDRIILNRNHFRLGTHWQNLYAPAAPKKLDGKQLWQRSPTRRRINEKAKEACRRLNFEEYDETQEAENNKQLPNVPSPIPGHIRNLTLAEPKKQSSRLAWQKCPKNKLIFKQAVEARRQLLYAELVEDYKKRNSHHIRDEKIIKHAT